MSPEPVLRIENLHHRYGRRPAVENLDLEVPPGSIFGLLGPNGSGKSTTLRLALGLLRRQAGQIDVLGIDPARDPVAAKQAIGYVGEQQGFYPWMRVGELVDFVAHYRPGWDAGYAEHLAEALEVDLAPKVSELSKGGRAMVALLLAVAFRPRLLILDEPTSALDPRARRRFLEGVLGEFHEGGGTVLISSHLIQEIAGLVDHVAILDRGRLVESAAVEDLHADLRRFELTFADTPPPRSIDCPGRVRQRIEGRRAVVTIRGLGHDRQGEAEARRALEATGATRIEENALGLEEIYLELTGRARSAGPVPGPGPGAGAEA